MTYRRPLRRGLRKNELRFKDALIYLNLNFLT